MRAPLCPSDPAAKCPFSQCLAHFVQQATCQFAELGLGSALASILHSNMEQGRIRMKSMMYQAYQNHMDLTAPWRSGAASALAISQPRAARRLRQTVRTARRGTRADLAHLAHLCPPGLRHRQGAGGQSGTGGDRGSRLRDAVRLAVAFQEGKFAGAAAHAAGGADVRPLRDAAARHREDAAAGPRRLHHRLAQSPRHSARARQVRPRRIYRAPHHLSRPDRSARAHGGDLPAVGVGAGGRRHHVGGQSPLAPGDADPDGRTDRHPHSAHQGQRIRQEQADEMVRGEPDQLRAVSVQGRVPRRSIPASCSSPPSCR